MKPTYQPSIGFLIALAIIFCSVMCVTQWQASLAMDRDRRVAADAIPFKRCANCFMPTTTHYRTGDDPSLCSRCWHEKNPLRVQITIGGKP